MNNEIKETKMIIKSKKYNGIYGVGSIFVDDIEITVQQLVNNSNHEAGIIKYSKNIGFCADERIGEKSLATVKTEIPFIVNYDKLNSFNEIVSKIKTNSDYKYNESHYTKDRFDLKSMSYIDIIIDGEEFEIELKDETYLKIFSEVLDERQSEISKMTEELYQKIADLIEKTN